MVTSDGIQIFIQAALDLYGSEQSAQWALTETNWLQGLLVGRTRCLWVWPNSKLYVEGTFPGPHMQATAVQARGTGLDSTLECQGERDQVRFMTPELLIPEQYAPPDKIPRNPGHALHPPPILSSLPPSCMGPCLKAPALSGKLEESMWPGLPAWQPLF